LIHPNIIKCFAVSETPSSVILITEYMAGGSLFHNLSNHNRLNNGAGAPIPKASALHIAIYIVRALNHIHSQGFSCGDVKSLNILLSHKLRPDGYLETGCTVKLCDFGLSKRLYHNYDASNSSSSLDLWNSTFFDPDAKNIAGTFAYLAPECFEKPASTPQGMIAADVYALGVVLWELFTGKIPWEGLAIGGLMKMMREKRKLEFDRNEKKFAGGKLVGLVNKCWADPNSRPNTEEILHALQDIYHSTEALSLVDSPTNVMQHAANVAWNNENKANFNYTGTKIIENGDTESLHDSLSSDDSTAIASINSDDEDFDADNSAFDISVSLLPQFANEVKRRKNLRTMRKARNRSDDDSSSSDDYGSDLNVRDYHDDDEDEEVAVFGNVDDVVLFDNPNKRTFCKERKSNYGRVATIREIPSEYPLQMDDSNGNSNSGYQNYDRVPTIREIQSEAILPNVDTYSASESCYSSSDDGSNYSSSIGDEDDINIGVMVEEEEIIDYNDNPGGLARGYVRSSTKPNNPHNLNIATAADAAHASSSSGSTVRNANHHRPPVHPIHQSFSSNLVAAPKHKKKKMAKEAKVDGCYVPEEFPAAGPGWLEATNELSEFEYTFQDKSIDSSTPPNFPPLPVELPRKPPQNSNYLTPQIEKRSASAPLPAEPNHTIPPVQDNRRPASQKSNHPNPQYHPLVQRQQQQQSPPMMQRFYSAAPPTPSQVKRQYISPVVEHKTIEEELEMFENLDANALVLGSVMKFSKFVQDNKT